MHTELVPEITTVTSEVTRLRRHLHQHPELSGEEHRTAEFIAGVLADWGLEPQTGVGGTGVVAVIDGEDGDGPTIGMRGEMDALPVTEERQHSYRSKSEGVMHACGHDAHCAMVLGAAKILLGRRGRLPGRVKLVFQPSEESEPSGAAAMIREGVLDAPRVDAMLGIHVFPHMTSGQIGVKPGVAAANADEFQILVHGRAGHAGYPHLAVDPIVASAHVIVALQTIASRRIKPLEPVVVTVGAVNGGRKANIIPPTIELLGTFRTMNPAIREVVAEEIDRVAQGVANSHGATAEVRISWGCPSVVNHPALCDLVKGAGERLLGEGNVLILPESMMGADDFAFYVQQVPGVHFRLGSGNADKGTEFPLHHPRFDIDEDVLPIGVAMLVETAESMMREGVPATP